MASILCTKGLERTTQVTLDDINYVAVGTGTAALAASDTQLGAETYRKTPDYKLRQGKTLQVRAQFANVDLPATSEEFGWFMNGGAGADTGELLSRALATFVKGSTDLFVILEIEIED